MADDTFTQDQLNAAVTKAVETANATSNTAAEGLRTKNVDLLAEKKGLAEKLAAFDGMDAGKIASMMKVFDNDEDAKLIAEGKWQEVIDKHVTAFRGETEATINKLTGELETITTERDGLKSSHTKNTINTAIRVAAETAEVLPAAIEDVLLRAASVFTLDKDGKVVALNKDGSAMLSKDGKDVLTPGVFLSDLKEAAPHYWPGSEGTGKKPDGKVNQMRADLMSQMGAAAEAGDMTLYRELRTKLKTAK